MTFCSSSSFCFSSFYRFVLYSSVVLSIRCVSSASLCPHESDVFLNRLQSRCALGISPNPPIHVDGNSLDRALTSKQMNGYTAVLFYASWCQFSHLVLPTFELLSSMFPQMDHFAIEQSLALPSMFSRYGIHSLPSILLVNQTSRLRYRGQKDLCSLVQFYEETTGLRPVEYFAKDESIGLIDSNKSITKTSFGSSMSEMIQREPYMVFSVLFLCLRMLVFIFPEVLSRLKAFWVSYVPHLNLEIFGETSQLFGRALHMIDVRRVWTKLRLCKTRNFRVWASSLASVSLGESSSSRS